MNIEIKNKSKEYDVIVCGGGPAGCAAAISAARQGVKVLVIEAGSALGGMATLGLVSKWAPFTDKEKVIYRSIPLEIIKKYKAAADIPEDKWDWINISPEKLKIVYDDLLSEAGAEVLFESRVCDVVKNGQNIESVIVSNKSGLTPYKAHIYIDCTGDADVAFYSGVNCEIGDTDGAIQPASLCFAIANVHMDKVTEKLGSNPKDGFWARVKQSGRFKLGCKHFIPAVFGENTVIANAGHLFNIDSTNPEEVSNALIKGRKIAEEYLEILKEGMPEAFADAFIVCTSNTLGVRESRRIEGEYRLTMEDYIMRRSFPDDIGRNCYWLDCHAAPGTSKISKIAPEDRHYKPGESHGIPFRCLIPKGVDNLLVAGRSISMERMVLSSVRVMPNCLAMGEAAGIGAAITVKKNIGVHEIDYKEVVSYIK